MAATAVRFHGRGDIRVEHLDEPQCGKGEVKVFLATQSLQHLESDLANTLSQMKPAFVGICGSGKPIHPSKPFSISRLDINILRSPRIHLRPRPNPQRQAPDYRRDNAHHNGPRIQRYDRSSRRGSQRSRTRPTCRRETDHLRRELLSLSAGL